MTDYKLVPVKQCAACGNAKPVSEMKICMHNQMHRYVCDSKCMNDFYNPPKNPRSDAAAPAVQGELVAFCEDAALSIAERTFSTEVDERLASDIIQYAQRLHSLYTAPQPAEQQPAPDVPGLTEALRQYQHNDGSGLVFGYDKLLVDQYVAQQVDALVACARASSAAEVGLIVDAALAAHRKGVEK